MKGRVTKTGYLDNSPDRFNDYNVILGENITMEGVSNPIVMFPIKNNKVGNPVQGVPGENYYFPGADGVLEMPIPSGTMSYQRMAKGGSSDAKMREVLSNVAYGKGGNTMTPELAAKILKTGSIYGKTLTASQKSKFAELAATIGIDENGDPIEEEEENRSEDVAGYKKGGVPKSKKKHSKTTSKNIFTAINEIFARNTNLYGSGGKEFYKPELKDGGWLDEYDLPKAQVFKHMIENYQGYHPSALAKYLQKEYFDKKYGGGLYKQSYGGDPSLPNITGHYQDGGDLKKYQTGDQVVNLSNQFIYPEEINKFANNPLQNRALACQGPDCLAGANTYYNTYVASKLGLPTSWKMLDDYGIVSGDPNQPYGVSLDSWDAAAEMQAKGAIQNYAAPLYGEDKKTRQDQKAAKRYWNLRSDEEKKNLYSQMALGTLVNFGDYGGVHGERLQGSNEKAGLYPSRHSARVVGFTESGVPVIYDYGHITRIDDPVFDFPITNITTPKELAKYNYQYVKDWQDKNKAKLDYDPKEKLLLTKGSQRPGEDPFTEDELKYVEGINKNIANLMQITGASQDDIIKAGKVAFGIMEGETRGGRGAPKAKLKELVKAVTPFTDESSKGLTRIKSEMQAGDETNKYSQYLKALGLNPKDLDLWDPEQAALATTALILSRKGNIEGVDKWYLRAQQHNTPGVGPKNTERLKQADKDYANNVIQNASRLYSTKTGYGLPETEEWMTKKQSERLKKEAEESKKEGAKALSEALKPKAMASESTGYSPKIIPISQLTKKEMGGESGWIDEYDLPKAQPGLQASTTYVSGKEQNTLSSMPVHKRLLAQAKEAAEIKRINNVLKATANTASFFPGIPGILGNAASAAYNVEDGDYMLGALQMIPDRTSQTISGFNNLISGKELYDFYTQPKPNYGNFLPYLTDEYKRELFKQKPLTVQKDGGWLDQYAPGGTPGNPPVKYVDPNTPSGRYALDKYRDSALLADRSAQANAILKSFLKNNQYVASPSNPEYQKMDRLMLGDSKLLDRVKGPANKFPLSTNPVSIYDPQLRANVNKNVYSFPNPKVKVLPFSEKPKEKPKEKTKPVQKKKTEVITPEYLPMIPASMPEAISTEKDIIMPVSSPKKSTNAGNRIGWTMDPETRKMVPVYVEGKQKVAQGKRLYNEYIPTSSFAIPEDFIPGFNRPELVKKTDPYWRREYVQPKNVATKKMGGWLDKYQTKGEVTSVAESTSVLKPQILKLPKDINLGDKDRTTLNYMYARDLLKKYNVDIDSTGNVLDAMGLNSGAYYNPVTRTIHYKRNPKQNPKIEYSSKVMHELPHAIQSDSMGVLPFLKNTFAEGIQDYLFNDDKNARYHNISKIEGHAHNILQDKLYRDRNAMFKKDGGWLEEYEEGGEKPWGEMTPKERAAYLDAKEKKKPVTKAQADAWAKQAEAKSRAQAKKEYYEDYVRESTKKVLTSPLFQAPGMVYASTMAPIVGLISSAPNLYESGKNIIKGEGDWSDYANIGLTALGIKGVAPNIKNTYNKVATGNSVLPVAWKMEQIADDVASFKNKYDLTNEEAIVLGKYINSPYNIKRGTAESKVFDNLVKRNKAILDDVKTPVTKVLNHSTTSDKDIIPTKFGSKFTFPGNRSWSLGVDPRFANTDRTRLVIPSKYNKDINFLGVPYEDARLAQGWNTVAQDNLTDLKGMINEKELIGNIPTGYKVIGSSNEGGFKNIFIKPVKHKYGGWLDDFE